MKNESNKGWYFILAGLILVVLWLSFLYSGYYFDTKKWREAYGLADKFEFANQSPSGLSYTFTLRDTTGQNKDLTAWVREGYRTYVCYGTNIVLYSTNQYYSKRLGKKLMEKVPENPDSVFLDRTMIEFEKYLKEYKNQK